MGRMISAGRFCDFVDNIIETENREKAERYEWEFYLHRVFEGTFGEFKAALDADRQNKIIDERTIETTLNHTFSILNKFDPEQNGGEA